MTFRESVLQLAPLAQHDVSVTCAPLEINAPNRHSMTGNFDLSRVVIRMNNYYFHDIFLTYAQVILHLECSISLTQVKLQSVRFFKRAVFRYMSNFPETSDLK